MRELEDTREAPVIAASETTHSIAPHSVTEEANAVAGSADGSFRRMQPQPQRPKKLFDASSHRLEPLFVVVQDDKIVAIADVITTTQCFFNKMIQWIEHHIGKKLARLIADRQAT